MSSSQYLVTQHVIPCQHIREYYDAVKDEQTVLQLAVTEYRPLSNLIAEPGSVTIIATHVNGFPKETYEPLWDDLLQVSTQLKIRAIWIADCSHQGASGVQNEWDQGDDPSWFDHSRDLLLMINHFRDRIHRPLIGVGHSLGAAQLVHLSTMHPSLFHSLALIEPVIQRTFPSGPNAAMLSSFRADLWSSRAAAEASLRKSPFFKTLDQRVIDKYLQFGLRETPTALYPEPAVSDEARVTLTTTKHQEAWSYVRPNFAPLSSSSALSESIPRLDEARLVAPDFPPNTEEAKLAFTRPESARALLALPYLRPSVLWVYGARSPVNVPSLREEKLKVTGTGPGGSGGVEAGRVHQMVLQGVGHLVLFEKSKECVTMIVQWMEKELQRWKDETEFLNSHKSGKSERDKMVLSKQWMKAMRQPADVKRPRVKL